MIQIKNKQDCCGCHACYNICPKHCISMREDTEGFWYPDIDISQCTQCRVCEKVCPLTKSYEEPLSNPSAYAAICKDDNIRIASSSGGVFTLLAESTLEQNGVIFGAQFDHDFQVVHGYAETKSEIEKFRGSKYVQSKIGTTYQQVRSFLVQGRYVLFTGTPCQIEGLQTYLGKKYERLICVDIICHGVPSPLVWKKYVAHRRCATKEIRRIAFRLKNEGWRLFSVRFEYSNRTEYIATLRKDLYMKGFLQDLYLRPSCYTCKLKKRNRRSDLTIADFWGIENVAPEMDDDRGTSLVVIHTERGREIFESLQSRLRLKQVDFIKAVHGNSAMVRSAKMNQHRDAFFRELGSSEQSIDTLLDQYTKVPLWLVGYRIIRRCLANVKRMINR